MDNEIMIEIPIRIRPEILISWAKAIRNECSKTNSCQTCIFYEKDENYPICVLAYRLPEDWALEHLSTKPNIELTGGAKE